MTRLLLPPGVAVVQGRRRLDAPNLYLPQISTSGVDPTTSARPLITATASGTAHTMGSWTQVVSATSDAIEWVELFLPTATGTAATNTATLLDIGIGGAGSEVVIVPGIQVGFRQLGHGVRVPVHIPVGSRVAVRCQSAVISKTVDLSVTFYGAIHGKASPTALVAFGNNAATSRGVALPAGGTINTKTAWTEITSGVTQPLGALIVNLDFAGDNSQPASNVLVDIGIGASGSEAVIIGDIFTVTRTSEDMYSRSSLIYPCNIPLNGRIAARWAFSDNTGALGVSVIGVPRQ